MATIHLHDSASHETERFDDVPASASAEEFRANMMEHLWECNPKQLLPSSVECVIEEVPLLTGEGTGRRFASIFLLTEFGSGKKIYYLATELAE